MIALSGGGTENGLVNFTVSPNRGVARTAIINVGVHRITITQEAAAGPHRTRFDFDGDGTSDITVYRDGIWYVLRSSDGAQTAVGWGGGPQDIPVPGDYDGDGKADVAVYRATTSTFFVLRSSDGGVTSHET